VFKKKLRSPLIRLWIQRIHIKLHFHNPRHF